MADLDADRMWDEARYALQDNCTVNLRIAGIDDWIQVSSLGGFTGPEDLLLVETTERTRVVFRKQALTALEIRR